MEIRVYLKLQYGSFDNFDRVKKKKCCDWPID